MKLRGFEPVEAKYSKSDLPTMLPTRATRGSAGYDFYLKEEVTIPPQTTILVYTDVKAKMMPDEVLTLHVRSSIGIKKKLMLANITGVIDSDYYNNKDTGGNIIIALYNYGNHPVTLKAGERIVQGIFEKLLLAVNDHVVSEGRVGGIGSTDIDNDN